MYPFKPIFLGRMPNKLCYHSRRQLPVFLPFNGFNDVDFMEETFKFTCPFSPLLGTPTLGANFKAKSRDGEGRLCFVHTMWIEWTPILAYQHRVSVTIREEPNP